MPKTLGNHKGKENYGELDGPWTPQRERSPRNGPSQLRALQKG